MAYKYSNTIMNGAEYLLQQKTLFMTNIKTFSLCENQQNCTNMAYKYSKTIQNGAETLIDGIDNIEMFLDDDDDWNFHDSEIHSFHWNRNTLTFTVTVMPMGYSAVIDGFYDGDAILLDFHFEDCIEVHMPNADLYSSPYIYEIEISKSHNFLECWFNGYSMRITSYRLRVDKPRLAEE